MAGTSSACTVAGGALCNRNAAMGVRSTSFMNGSGGVALKLSCS